MSKTLTQVTEELAAKQAKMKAIFDEAGPDLDMSKVKSIDGDSAAKVAALTSMEKELDDLFDERKKLDKLSGIRAKADAAVGFTEEKGASLKNDPTQANQKSIGQLIMESPAVKGERQRVHLDLDPKGTLLDVSLKANFFTTSGWAPFNVRRPGYVEAPNQAALVVDFLPIYPTENNSVLFMLETTRTSNAAEKTEGDSAAESALALTETSVPVQEIATFVPTSRTQLEDVAFASAYLTNTLNRMVRQKLSSQILNGSGTPPALKGTLNIGGSLQTEAKGNDSIPDAIYKGMTKVRSVGFTDPSVVFAHPNDWQDVRLLKTADGIYIFGNPNDPGADRIWGVPVCVTTECAENTMILGDYANYAFLAMRRGIEVEMSSGYSDYFVKGKLAVLASLRAAVVHTRTAAFCTITGV